MAASGTVAECLLLGLRDAPECSSLQFFSWCGLAVYSGLGVTRRAALGFGSAAAR